MSRGAGNWLCGKANCHYNEFELYQLSDFKLLLHNAIAQISTCVPLPVVLMNLATNPIPWPLISPTLLTFICWTELAQISRDHVPQVSVSSHVYPPRIWRNVGFPLCSTPRTHAFPAYILTAAESHLCTVPDQVSWRIGSVGCNVASVQTPSLTSSPHPPKFIQWDSATVFPTPFPHTPV